MAQTSYSMPVQTPLFEVVNTSYRNGNSARYGVVTLPSSDGKREYRVDVTNGRCSCPAWKFSKTRQTCKHLKALGFRDLVKSAPVNYANTL